MEDFNHWVFGSRDVYLSDELSHRRSFEPEEFGPLHKAAS